MTKNVFAKVFKYDPSRDTEPYYETYEVPWKPYLTVLEVLRYISENYEDIAFDYGCRARYCGRCGMMVNGKPVLACLTPVEPGEVTIEPLKNFPVIRDLVVDRSRIKSRLFNIRPSIQRKKPMKEIADVPYETFLKTYSLNNCRECLLCYTVCPVINDPPKGSEMFCGPAVLLRLAQRFYDPRDEADRVAEAVHEGLWQCIMCGRCHEACLYGSDVLKDLPLIYVDHLANYRALRKAAEERGLTP